MTIAIKRNIIALLMLTFVCMGAYYFLLHDTYLELSIASIIAKSNHLELKKHLIVLGILPIYIALIVFGTAVFGVYIGTALQRYIYRFFNINGF